ncbi:MAG: DUF1285 domain-containing protein [Pseudomonadota bacterium]
MTMAEMVPIDSAGKHTELDSRLAEARMPPSAADEAYAIRIRSDGVWTYHGSPIERPALVKLFASVLRRDDDGDYWLITPAERGRITVDDAPFIAVDVAVEGQGAEMSLTFRTNLGEVVVAGPDRPIRVTVDEATCSPRPYVLVRDGLEALISRPVFYALADLAVEQEGVPGVWSLSQFFALDRPSTGPAD